MEWSVRLTEDDLAMLMRGGRVEKTLHVGVLVITPDPESGWSMTFLPERR